jgi:membrane associated rhomboid family serine protease
MFFPVQDENPTRHPPVLNNMLIIANIAVFVCQLVLGEQFILTWSFVPARLTALLSGDGDVRVLLTMLSAMFMHGSIGHIAGNMLFLWVFGDNIEDHLGSVGFLAFYLVCGVLATLAQYVVDPTGTIPNLGASGAISGVLGAYIILFPFARVSLFFWPFSLLLGTLAVPAFLWLGLWFVLQLATGFQEWGRMFAGGVAFWAHIGGFVAGLILIRVFPARRIVGYTGR